MVVLQDDDRVLAHRKVVVSQVARNREVEREVDHEADREEVHEEDREVGHGVDHAEVREVDQEGLEDAVLDADEVVLAGRTQD